MPPVIRVHDHCRKHTPTSKFSHYEGSLEDVAALAMKHWTTQRDGDHKPAILVTVPAEGFFTSVVKVSDETRLVSTFAQRERPADPNEDKHLQHKAIGGQKLPAQTVELVIYVEVDACWLVTILASLDDTTPMDPQTMWRNQTGQPGGTKAHYTSEQWATSTRFWGTHALCAPE